MSETIGRGVIELSADSQKLNAAIGEARRSIKDLGNASAQNNARSSASIDRYVRSLQTQAAVQGKSSREADLYRLAIRGASDEQLRAANSALKLAEAHKRGEEIGSKFRAGLSRFGADLAKASAVAGAALGGAALIADRVLQQVGNLQDLAEKTGETAENLGSLTTAAGTAGNSLDEIATFAIKLQKNLTGVDDESSKAGAALKAIGLNVNEIKRLGAADQLEAIARALAKFDDKGKPAVMEAIAKGGAQLLPFLRELGAEGGRQVILTQQMIEAADAFNDRQARARSEIRQYAGALATGAIPAIEAFTGELKDLAKQFLQVDSVTGRLRANNEVSQFADTAAIRLAYLVDIARGVGRAFVYVGETIAATAAIASRLGNIQAAKLMFSGSPGKAIDVVQGEAAAIDAIVKAARKRGDELLDFDSFGARVKKRVDERRAQAGAGSSAGKLNPPLGQINFDGAEKKDKTAEKAKKEAEEIAKTYRRLELGIQDYIGSQQAEIANAGPLSAARRQHIESLKQIDDAENKLSETQRIKLRTQAGEARDIAERNEALAAQRKGREDLIASRAREEEAARAETAQIREGNTAVFDQIRLMSASLQTQAAIERARLQSIITRKEERLAILGGAEAIGFEADELRQQIGLLRLRSGAIGQSAADQADPWFRSAESIRRYGEDAANVGEQIAQAMERGFASAEDALVRFTMTGKLSFRDFASSVVADIARIQARQAIASVVSKGGSFLSSIFGAALGSFGGGAGSISGGSGLTFGGPRATGGPVDGGTAYLVGERGRELFVPERSGSIVPNHALGGGEPITIINQTTGRIDEAQETRLPNGERAIIIREAVMAARRDRAGALSDPNSSDSRAMRRNFDVARSR